MTTVEKIELELHRIDVRRAELDAVEAEIRMILELSERDAEDDGERYFGAGA